MEVTTAKRPAQRRKSAKKAKEAEDLVVPVGEHGTLEGLPTELLEDIVVLLILSHPRHALDLGQSNKFFYGLVHSSLGWKRITEAAKLKVPKPSKKVPFPCLTAVSKNWSKLCWGCYGVKRDKVPVEYDDADPLMLCGECRIARYDPSKDEELETEGMFISRVKARDQYKLTDRQLSELVITRHGFPLDEVIKVARKLHGGDAGIKAVVSFNKERREHLRTTRQEKKAERERLAVENRKLRKEALDSRLEKLGLQIPETHPQRNAFVDSYHWFPKDKSGLYVADSDVRLEETVTRIVEWDRTRKERLKTLPEDLKKHGLEYSAESMWCTAYIEQYEDNMMRFGMVPGAGKLTLERVVNELSELKWFFEHTNYRTIRFGPDAGLDRTYLNDDDSGNFRNAYIPRPHRPYGLLSVTTAQNLVIRSLIDARFAKDNKEKVTNEDEGFKEAPAGIIAWVNEQIDRKLNPNAHLLNNFFTPMFPFGGYFDGMDSGSEDGFEEDEDVCSIM